MAKIKKIKIGSNDALDIEDAVAIHTLNTYNGGKTFGSINGVAADVSLADTPIENSEIEALFAAE